MFYRYISEDFGGQALHPIDVMDAQTGLLMLQLKDPNLPTITPVNKIHPRLDAIVSGSSRSLYAWKPAPQGAAPNPFLQCNRQSCIGESVKVQDLFCCMLPP